MMQIVTNTGRAGASAAVAAELPVTAGFKVDITRPTIGAGFVRVVRTAG